MTTTPLTCKFCHEADDRSCSCTRELAFDPQLAGTIDRLMGAVRAGYYVIDGRPTTDQLPDRRT